MQKIIGIAPGPKNSVVIQSVYAEQLAPAVLCSPDPKTAQFDGINS